MVKSMTNEEFAERSEIQEKIESYLNMMDGLEFQREFSSPEFKNPFTNGRLRFDFAIKLPDGKHLLIEMDGEYHDEIKVDDQEFVIERKLRTLTSDFIKNTIEKIYSDKFVIRRIHHTDDVLERLLEILLEFYVITSDE